MVEVSSASLDIELLRSFQAVAQQGSLAGAATQRHRTVSAISMQIKRLESVLDTRLLSRGARGMTLTPTGESLLREVRELLRQHDALMARFTGRGLSGKVLFGMPEDYASAMVGDVLPEFLAQHPDVLLETVTAPSGELAHLVETGELAMAVMLDRPHRLQGGEPLWTTSPVWVTGREARTSEALDQALPLALHTEQCPYRALALEALERCHRPWYPVFTSSSIHAVETAVAAGLAISVLDRERVTSAMRVLGEEDGLPALSACEARLYFAERIHRDSRQAVEALATMLRERLFQRGPWHGNR